MPNIKRKFKVTTSTETRFVTPIDDDGLNYKFKRLENSLNYSLELETELTFTNNVKEGIDDFDFFYSYEKNISTQCEEIVCEIYKTCSGVDTLEYTGVIPLKSGKWDLDRCKVTLKLQPQNDIYDCIANNKKDTDLAIASFYPYFNSGPGTSPDFTHSDYNTDEANRYFGTPTGYPFGWYDTTVPGVYTLLYSYGYIIKITSDGSYWMAVGHGVWTRVHINDGVIQSGFFNVYDEQVGGLNNFLTIKKLNINGMFFNERMDPSNDGFFQIPYISFAVVCYFVVRELLVKCGLDSNAQALRSDFFDWNPKGDTDGYVASTIAKLPNNMPNYMYPNSDYRYIYLPKTPGINYYTGETNHLTHIQIIPKSNANNPSASSWEQPLDSSLDINVNRLSFEDIERIWFTKFDCHWFIDTDGCMRVEHRSWFNTGAALYDSTSAENQKWNVAKRKYDYKTELLPKKEIFRDSTNIDTLNGKVETGFGNKYNQIFYDSICTNKIGSNSEQEYALPKTVTDVSTIDSKNNSLADKYDTDGVFMCVIGFGATTDTIDDLTMNYKNSLVEATVLSEVLVGSISMTTYENGHIQWANLIRRYLKENRVLSSGQNGPDVITFSSRTRKTKVQKNIILMQCCDTPAFNPKQAQIITELGIGDIDEAIVNTKTDQVKINALHD